MSGCSSTAGAGGGGQGHGVAGDSIVLEEEIDPNYIPTQVRLPMRHSLWVQSYNLVEPHFRCLVSLLYCTVSVLYTVLSTVGSFTLLEVSYTLDARIGAV